MTKIAKAAIGADVTQITLETAGRGRPGWSSTVAPGPTNAHPGFMRLTYGQYDSSLTHPNGWDPNDNYVLEQSASNLAQLVVEPGETTVVWYVDNENGMDAAAIAAAETAAGRPIAASRIDRFWIVNQTTTDYGKRPEKAVKRSLMESMVRYAPHGTSPWLRIKAGTELEYHYFQHTRGESMLHPILVNTYGDGDRALITGTVGGNVTGFAKGNVVFQNLDINQFYSNNNNAVNTILADVVWTDHEPVTSGYGFKERLTLWAAKSSHLALKVPRNGTNWSSGSEDRSSGMYFSKASKIYQRYAYYDHAGYADGYHLQGRYLNDAGVPTWGQPPNYYSHNQYHASDNTYSAIVEMFSLRSPFSHMQKRSGGEDIVCVFAHGNAMGNDGGGFCSIVLQSVAEVESFGPGQLLRFSDSDVTIKLDSGGGPTSGFWIAREYPSINTHSTFPPGFNPVGRVVTSDQGGSGVVTDMIQRGSYSAKTAVVVTDLQYKKRDPMHLIGVYDSAFQGLENNDWVHDWVAIMHPADPNNPADLAYKAGINWRLEYNTSHMFYRNVTVFNWGAASNEINAAHISQQDRIRTTLGSWVDEKTGSPLGTYSSEEACDWLDSHRNPGLMALDYVDYVAQKIGQPSPKRTEPGPCRWTPYERLSGHNADQPRNWTVLDRNFVWPIDGDDLILDGGKPHWLRTCRAVDISLGEANGVLAEPVLYGGLMSSSGVVSGNGKVTLKNGGQFWYLGTNTGNQRFDGDGGRLGIAGTVTGLDVRVGDAAQDGWTEIAVLAGATAGFTTLHLTGRATLKLDGIGGTGTAAVTIGNLRMTKTGTSIPRIGKIRTGRFGINPATHQPYNPALTGNVTITGTITAVGYGPGEVVIDPTATGTPLNSLVTTGASFVGCSLVNGKVVAT